MKAALDYNLEGLKLYEDIDNKPMLADHPMDRKAVRQGLSEAYTRVGTTRYRLGELTPALEYYRKAYNIRRELIAEAPENPVYKQELSYTLIALAELSFRLGDRARGEDYYQQALEMREGMAKLRPDDLKVQKELGDVFYMVGEFKLRGGELAASRTYLEKCRATRQALVDREPRNAILRRDLGLAFYRLGGLAEAEKNPEQARKDFQASLGICEDLAKQSAENDRRQTELMLSLAHAGDPTRARELADRIAAGPNVDRELRVDLARAYAQSARATPPADTERVQTALVKAVEAVRTAVRGGYRDRVFLETEPDLEPLRGREDFRQILAELRPS
jgi:tetratricopeptide (TPR) repeat protein